MSKCKGSEAGKRDAPAVLTMSLQVLGCGPLELPGGFWGEEGKQWAFGSKVLNWGFALGTGSPSWDLALGTYGPSSLITCLHGTHTQGDIQLPMPPQWVDARPPGAGHLHHGKWQVGLC